MKIMSKLGLALAGILCGALLVWFGFHFGRATAPKAPPPQVVSAVAGCPQTPEAMARRNVVWRGLNGDLEGTDPDTMVAAALAIIIRPELPPQVRNIGISKYMNKSTIYFSKEEIEGLAESLANGPQEKRMEAFGRIAAVDLSAAQLISCVLADTERVNLFIAGKPVPLEEPVSK